jgi:ubiquinone/menaquinone biosynthesis C-methylase UbiE
MANGMRQANQRETQEPVVTTASSSKSAILHSGARHYDLLVWLVTFGRERALRERLIDIAGIAAGETVIDIGCGTGSLAVAAKRRVGRLGKVLGIDASPEMIAQARAKSSKSALDVEWQVAGAEALPVADASVDVVLSTLMMHHLPRAVRRVAADEIRRVLKPGGRALVVDFEPPAERRGSLISRLHRHGHVPAREVRETLTRSQLRVIDMGAVGASDLHFAVATPAMGDGSDVTPPAYRRLPRLPVPRQLIVAAVVAIAAIVHGLIFSVAWHPLAIGSLATVGLVAMLLAHGALGGGVHALLSRRKRS